MVCVTLSAVVTLAYPLTYPLVEANSHIIEYRHKITCVDLADGAVSYLQPLWSTRHLKALST